MCEEYLSKNHFYAYAKGKGSEPRKCYSQIIPALNRGKCIFHAVSTTPLKIAGRPFPSWLPHMRLFCGSTIPLTLFIAILLCNYAPRQHSSKTFLDGKKRLFCEHINTCIGYHRALHDNLDTSEICWRRIRCFKRQKLEESSKTNTK